MSRIERLNAELKAQLREFERELDGLG